MARRAMGRRRNGAQLWRHLKREGFRGSLRVRHRIAADGRKRQKRKACDRFLPPGPSPDCARKPADAAVVAELMTDLVRSRIVPHRTPRARLRTHSSWAELAALLDCCSQPSAELLVQFSETIRSLHSAFFKGNSLPLQHSGPPNGMHCDAL